jgi:hypothetical protein
VDKPDWGERHPFIAFPLMVAAFIAAWRLVNLFVYVDWYLWAGAFLVWWIWHDIKHPPIQEWVTRYKYPQPGDPETIRRPVKAQETGDSRENRDSQDS